MFCETEESQDPGSKTRESCFLFCDTVIQGLGCFFQKPELPRSRVQRGSILLRGMFFPKPKRSLGGPTPFRGSPAVNFQKWLRSPKTLHLPCESIYICVYFLIHLFYTLLNKPPTSYQTPTNTAQAGILPRVDPSHHGATAAELHGTAKRFGILGQRCLATNPSGWRV